MTTSAIYALIHKLERDGGVWFAKGGTNRAGRRHGARISSGSAARSGSAIRSTAIETRRRPRHRRCATTSGWRERVRRGRHQRRRRPHLRPARRPSRAARRRPRRLRAQALLAVAVRGPFRRARAPGRTCRTTSSCSARATRGCSTTSTSAAGCADDPSLYLHHPTATDPHGAAGHARPSTRWRRCRISASCRSTGTRRGRAMRDRILAHRRAAAAAGPARAASSPCSTTRPRDFDDRSQRPSRLGLQPRADADPERLVPRPQSRRRDPQPLFRRRRHPSGRGHPRRGRQRQGDRRADDRGSRAHEPRPRSSPARCERTIQRRLQVLPLRQPPVRPARRASGPGCSTAGAAHCDDLCDGQALGHDAARRRSRQHRRARGADPTARWPASRSASRRSTRCASSLRECPIPRRFI